MHIYIKRRETKVAMAKTKYLLKIFKKMQLFLWLTETRLKN